MRHRGLEEPSPHSMSAHGGGDVQHSSVPLDRFTCLHPEGVGVTLEFGRCPCYPASDTPRTHGLATWVWTVVGSYPVAHQGR